MTCRIGFVMEQTLGHVTHHANLASSVREDASIEAVWMPIPFHADDAWSRLPGVRDNWSLRAGLRTRRKLRRRMKDAVREGARRRPFDALFFHTQLTALCSFGLISGVPSVISLDATPKNMASLAAGYGRRTPGAGMIREVKTFWNQQLFRRVAAITTINHWTRESLIHDYGIAGEKITVIPWGVDTDDWRPPPRRAAHPGRPRLLFVGGDFTRKGGPLLLDALRGGLAGRCEVDVVTRDSTIISDGPVRVHHGLGPNQAALRRLFTQADMFVLPTQADCSPFVIIEAMACGLPVVAADVGAIREMVNHGETGLLVAPGDSADLARALGELIDAPDRRRSMGRMGRQRAEQRFSSQVNHAALIRLIQQTAALCGEAGVAADACLGFKRAEAS